MDGLGPALKAKDGPLGRLLIALSVPSSPQPIPSAIRPGSSALRGLPGKTVPFGTENTPEIAEGASEQENGNKFR